MTEVDILLLDGNCGLCNRLALFLKPRLRNPEALQFLGQESEQGAKLMDEMPEAIRSMDTVVLLRDGQPQVRSTAILRAMLQLPWYWAVWARIGLLVPRALRDLVYRPVARYRRRLFTPPDRCAF